MDSTEEKPSASLTASLEVVQALANAGGTGKHWFITKGAQSVNNNDIILPWQSQFWGFGRTLQVEYPDALGACIDLDPAADETMSSLDMLVKEICSSSLETEVAFRKGFINAEELKSLAEAIPQNEYGSYLMRLL